MGPSPRARRLSVNAQSQFAPYYGKNQIHYDKFEWHIYKTDHFEIYYYPENEQHLERVASYAESAYQQVSSDLRHDLNQRVPLIIFKTHSEFEQQNIAPGAAQEGVLAFAEGERNRMVLPIDLPSDLLYGLIVHELTHVFQYRLHPDVAAPPQHAAVGARRRRRIRARHLGSARSDDGPRRGGRRHHPAHEPDGRLRRLRQPAPGLQPRPRALRVHRSTLGQGRRAAVPLLAAQERHRRRHEPVRRSVPDAGARVRPAVREIPERSLQGVPRQGAAGRLRPGPLAGSREIAIRRAPSRSSRRRRAISSP